MAKEDSKLTSLQRPIVEEMGDDAICFSSSHRVYSCFDADRRPLNLWDKIPQLGSAFFSQ